MYTTHSPFMVDPDDLLSVRTVEDVVEGYTDGRPDELLGTKVGDRILSTDPDTVFPLQSALGYDITQTLFVGKNTLLVEGPSDLLYLKWASEELRGRGRISLDPRWVIAPAGGIDKVGSFVTLFRSTDLNVAVLTDFHKGIKGKVRSLRESEILKSGHVLSCESYVDADQADVEDIVGRSNYSAIVTSTYELDDEDVLPTGRPADAPPRVVEEVEAHFRVRPHLPEFDHFTPAAHLVANAATLTVVLPELDLALDRFERIFEDLDQLLADERPPI